MPDDNELKQVQEPPQEEQQQQPTEQKPGEPPPPQAQLAETPAPQSADAPSEIQLRKFATTHRLVCWHLARNAHHTLRVEFFLSWYVKKLMDYGPTSFAPKLAI